MIPNPFHLASPVGSVVAFSGFIQSPPSTEPGRPDTYNTNPIPEGFGLQAEVAGWMVCDGRELNAMEYPDLYKMIGFLYSHPRDRYQPGQEF